MTTLINVNTQAIITVTAETVKGQHAEAASQGFQLSYASFRNLVRGVSAQVGEWELYTAEESELVGFYATEKTQARVVECGRMVVTQTSNGYRVKVKLNAANRAAKKIAGAAVKSGYARFTKLSADAVNALASKLA